MSSFEAKTVWTRPRKRENKNYRFVLFLPDASQKIQKIQQKNKKMLLWLRFKPILVEGG